MQVIKEMQRYKQDVLGITKMDKDRGKDGAPHRYGARIL